MKNVLRFARALLATLAALLISMPAAAAVEVSKEVYAYIEATPSRPAVLLDLYRPASSVWRNHRPAVVLIHGGGWGAGDRSELSFLGNYLASNGIVAIAIDYRLAPAFRWPEQLFNAQEAVWWLRRNAKNLQIHSNKIAALGGSAGATIAAMLGSSNAFDPKSGLPSQVQGVVSLWGPWNLTNVYNPGVLSESPLVKDPNYDPYNYRIIQSDPAILQTPAFTSEAKGMLNNLLGPDPHGLAAQVASPYSHISYSSAPTLMFHGTKDALVPPSQSVQACARLLSLGVACKLVLLNGEGHHLPSHLSEPSDPTSRPNLDIMFEALQTYMGRWISDRQAFPALACTPEQ